VADVVESPVDDATENEDEPIELTYSITSYGADYPVDGLIKRIQDSTVFIPPFQRRFVWSQSQASRFVESLLLGLPVPGIFLARERETNRSLVIDGQQRLRSLQFFYEGVFGKRAFELVGVARAFKGKTYRTLSDEDRRKLDDSIIHATVVRQEQPSDDESSIYLIFERLNTGGMLLQPQEIRAAVYHGAMNEVLHGLNQDQHWRNIFGPENDRLKDQELVLRFLALYFDFAGYRKPMKEALNRYMGRNRDLKVNSQAELQEAFLPTIAMLDDQLGQSAFRPTRNINAAVFDSVMVGLARRLSRGPVDDPAQLKERYQRLILDDDFRGAYARSTSDEEQVQKRVEAATAAFEGL
jgi:hypothetical protein